jgi:hypothetical protein
MEHISDYYFDFIDDNEGLSPEVWISQFDLQEEEKEYFLSLLK